jgi:hypothetical protein
MVAAVPASQLVNVLPGVLAAGGNPLSLNAIFLTSDTSVPIGTVAAFPSAETVADFFGASSQEAILANIYFDGFDTSSAKPSSLYFAQYNTGAVAAYLRSGSFAGVTLSQLQLLSGTLILDIDGTPETTGSINFAGASSFSNAAALVQTALNAVATGTTCTYDSQLNAFVIVSPTTGAASTLTFATGTLAAGLKVQAAQGAVLSQGAVAAVPATFMAAIVAITQNWATFTTTFEASDDLALALAAWSNGANDRYLYVMWDSDIAPTQGVDPTSLGAQVAALEYDGVMPVYDLDGTIAAFICGTAASIDFEQPQGRITFAYKGQAGLVPAVTSEIAYANLLSNSYNCYARFATANDNFTNLQPGSVPGAWRWADSFLNQIWFNNALQLAYTVLLTSVNSIPYNQQGYNLLRATALDPVNAALNAGVIQPGVTLSNSQRAQINTAVGASNAADVVQTQGWLLDIHDATPEQRAQRASPPMTLYYTDGGSVQKIELSSIEVQ